MNHYGDKKATLSRPVPRPKRESVLTEQKVLDILRESPHASNHAISMEIGVSTRTVARAIASMAATGSLKKETTKVKLANWYNNRTVEIIV
jgi:predicted transcriptional regulator